jgi:hypothetical protein
MFQVDFNLIVFFRRNDEQRRGFDLEGGGAQGKGLSPARN